MVLPFHSPLSTIRAYPLNTATSRPKNAQKVVRARVEHVVDLRYF